MTRGWTKTCRVLRFSRNPFDTHIFMSRLFTACPPRFFRTRGEGWGATLTNLVVFEMDGNVESIEPQWEGQLRGMSVMTLWRGFIINHLEARWA